MKNIQYVLFLTFLVQTMTFVGAAAPTPEAQTPPRSLKKEAAISLNRLFVKKYIGLFTDSVMVFEDLADTFICYAEMYCARLTTEQLKAMIRNPSQYMEDSEPERRAVSPVDLSGRSWSTDSDLEGIRKLHYDKLCRKYAGIYPEGYEPFMSDELERFFKRSTDIYVGELHEEELRRIDRLAAASLSEDDLIVVLPNPVARTRKKGS